MTGTQARREIARACGVALLETTSLLDGEAEIAEGVDPMGLVLLAFGARGRRLLRSAYRLIDARVHSRCPRRLSPGGGAESRPLLQAIAVASPGSRETGT